MNNGLDAIVYWANENAIPTRNGQDRPCRCIALIWSFCSPGFACTSATASCGGSGPGGGHRHRAPATRASRSHRKIARKRLCLGSRLLDLERPLGLGSRGLEFATPSACGLGQWALAAPWASVRLGGGSLEITSPFPKPTAVPRRSPRPIRPFLFAA